MASIRTAQSVHLAHNRQIIDPSFLLTIHLAAARKKVALSLSFFLLIFLPNQFNFIFDVLQYGRNSAPLLGLSLQSRKQTGIYFHQGELPNLIRSITLFANTLIVVIVILFRELFYIQLGLISYLFYPKCTTPTITVTTT